MKYLNYDLEDYLTDPQFIDWALHPNEENQHFWQEWIKNHPDHSEKISQARDILLKMKFHTLEPTHEDFDDVLAGIRKGKRPRHHLKPQSSIQYRFADSSKLLWRVAAVFLLLVLGAAAFLKLNHQEPAFSKVDTRETYVVKKNPRGQRSIIELPDGSKVHLNAESEITYAEGFDGPERKVKLKGEAFFEVAEDTAKPFIVEAAGLYTKALGTSFNVKAYDEKDATSISLASGKVAVGLIASTTHASGQIYLNPGEKASYVPSNGLKKELLDYQEDIAWKEGVLFFKNASLQEVVQKLERWYDVKFIVTGSPRKEWHFNGSFKGSSLERALDRISFVQGFEYELKGRNIFITFNN